MYLYIIFWNLLPTIIILILALNPLYMQYFTKQGFDKQQITWLDIPVLSGPLWCILHKTTYLRTKSGLSRIVQAVHVPISIICRYTKPTWLTWFHQWRCLLMFHWFDYFSKKTCMSSTSNSSIHCIVSCDIYLKEFQYFRIALFLTEFFI